MATKFYIVNHNLNKDNVPHAGAPLHDSWLGG